MGWLLRLFGRTSSNGEKKAQAAENNVDRLEDRAADQGKRLDAATRRVARAVEQVRRVEQIAKKHQ